MKTVATFSVILLCAAVVSVLLGWPRLSGGLCRAEESETGDEGEAEGDVAAGSARIRADAVLVQADGGAMGEIERAAGIKLSPNADQMILKPEQMDKLLAAVRENPGARIVASSSAVLLSGKKGLIQLEGELFGPTRRDSEEGKGAEGRGGMREIWSDSLSHPSVLVMEEGGQIEVVQEITYPTYDSQTTTVRGGTGGGIEISPKQPPASGAAARLKKVIAPIKLTPTVMKGGRIALVATLHISVVSSPSEVEVAGERRPLFRTWTKTTSLVIGDGSSFALKQAAIIPFSPAPAEEKPSPQKQEILRKLAVVIPALELDDAKLEEVVRYLSKQAELNIVIDPAAFTGHGRPLSLPETPSSIPGETMTPGPTGIPGAEGPFLGPTGDVLTPGVTTPGVTAPGVTPETTPTTPVPPTQETGITISLTNVPLSEVLRYVLRYKNLKYVVEDHAVVVAPADWTPPKTLETEIYRFGPGGIDVEPIGGPAVEPSRAGASGPGGKPQSPEAQGIQDFLRDSGIPWPEGSSLNYDADKGIFIVTNTSENMALIRESLPLWADPESRGVLLTIVSVKLVE